MQLVGRILPQSPHFSQIGVWGLGGGQHRGVSCCLRLNSNGMCRAVLHHLGDLCGYFLQFQNCGSRVTYNHRDREKGQVFPRSICNFAQDRNCVEIQILLRFALCGLQRDKFLPNLHASKIGSRKPPHRTEGPAGCSRYHHLSGSSLAMPNCSWRRKSPFTRVGAEAQHVLAVVAQLEIGRNSSWHVGLRQLPSHCRGRCSFRLESSYTPLPTPSQQEWVAGPASSKGWSVCFLWYRA